VPHLLRPARRRHSLVRDPQIWAQASLIRRTGSFRDKGKERVNCYRGNLMYYSVWWESKTV
jgi:hypothetical protein